jgi:hypothetical protein
MSEADRRAHDRPRLGAVSGLTARCELALPTTSLKNGLFGSLALPKIEEDDENENA